MGELKITFAGICVHVFDASITGVPMRTVLPDATAVRFGAIRAPKLGGGQADFSYYTMPHVAMARDLVIGGRHHALTGWKLTVSNATSPAALQRILGKGFALPTFKNGVELSTDVVVDGNAMAYFDILGGEVVEEGSGNDARTTTVTVQTDGMPILSITPLPGCILPPEQEFVTVDTGTLFVTNLDYDPATEDAGFDFLLNYLVVRGGIPSELTERTPGMPDEPPPVNLSHLGERLRALATLIETGGTVTGWTGVAGSGLEPAPAASIAAIERSPTDHETYIRKLASFNRDPVPFDQSCSDSNYP